MFVGLSFGQFTLVASVKFCNLHPWHKKSKKPMGRGINVIGRTLRTALKAFAIGLSFNIRGKS